jgi:hypothetical protein
MNFITLIGIAFGFVIVILGALLAYTAFSAFRRTGESTMAYIGLGFSLASIAMLIFTGGVFLAPDTTQELFTMKYGITAIGYLILVYAVLSHDPLST